MKPKNAARLLLCVLLVCLSRSAEAGKEAITTDVPDVVDPEQRYLFYLHGAWIEQHGLQEAHPKHGRYEYHEIVEALAQEGFVVISTVRLSAVHPVEYADSVAEQVRALLDRGVPPERITIAGHSKGGHMALLVASELQEPAMRLTAKPAVAKKRSIGPRTSEAKNRSFAPAVGTACFTHRRPSGLMRLLSGRLNARRELVQRAAGEAVDVPRRQH